MTEYKAQQFTVEPDPGDPAAELSLRKIDQFMTPVAQIAFGNDSNTYLSFQSNPGGAMAEQMRIHTNGNVGIGTATPGEKLEVAGTVKATAFDGNLNGSQITTGTIVDTRLPLSVSRTADVDVRFDPSTGHKHTGTAGDGSQISHSTLTAIIGADPGSTDAQTNKHVSNAQTKQWQDHAGVTSGNPHGTTAAQVGSPVSVEGVTNPGGNIDLVNSNAITIAGNNTTKQITIGETHSTRTDNPHSTTAVQVGALTSVDGVSNAGGNVDLVNSNAITISGNNTTKQITIGETHSARTDNPHNTTATQLGALASVDGVSNAGGNVDLVNSNAITITGDNTTKQITIGETHSTRTDNPHSTTASQVGALISVDGVSNGGGNIDLVNSNAITITGDNVTKQITIGESHSTRTDNPHVTTAAQVGAPVSVEGVSNPGGNIDLVNSNAITITGNNVTKQITIGESHSALRNNPHVVTAAQVGALSTGGGTVYGALTATGSASFSSSTALIGNTLNDNHIGIGRPADKKVTMFITGALSTGVGTSINTTVMIWPLTTGVGALYIIAASGAVDTLTCGGTARFSGTKIGYVADTCVNGSGTVLRTGDIVKLKSGGVVRFHGDNNRIPIPEVALADHENDPLVMGIVCQEATPAPDEPDGRTEPDDPTAIPDGGDLFVVTLGTFAHCKVDATEASIEVGDLLTSSSNPGYAKKAVNPKIGCIIGKALEPLKEGTGYISVFVNIQ